MKWRGRKNLLCELSRNVSIPGMYLAGGTALSLMTGWRESADFDFFTEHPFNADLTGARLKEMSKESFVPLNIYEGTCDAVIDGVQVRFFQYPYPNIASRYCLHESDCNKQ